MVCHSEGTVVVRGKYRGQTPDSSGEGNRFTMSLEEEQVDKVVIQSVKRFHILS
jgi:hypothetical protein